MPQEQARRSLKGIFCQPYEWSSIATAVAGRKSVGCGDLFDALTTGAPRAALSVSRTDRNRDRGVAVDDRIAGRKSQSGNRWSCAPLHLFAAEGGSSGRQPK